jgi:hypothetical protein
MAAPVVEVITPDSDPDLFTKLTNADDETVQYYSELCEGAMEFQADPHRVGWLADQATHILQLISFDQVVTFAYLNVSPYDKDDRSYADLILLCGSYDFEHGTTTWKGSEVLIDKAMQLAREAGKKSLRLEALNTTLYTKVYEPMGFRPVPGKRLVYERPLPSGGRKRKTRRRSRTRKTKSRARK